MISSRISDVLLFVGFFTMFISSLCAQNGYEAYIKANQYYQNGNTEDAYKTLKTAASQLMDFPEKMSFQEAYDYFNLYEITTYSQGKMGEIDNLYLNAIAYGEYIDSEALQCKYTLFRGNLFRIKNQWTAAIQILKSALKFDCLDEDYIQIHAILGKCYNQINFDSTLYYTMAVLPAAEERQDSANLMLLYNNLVGYYKKSNRKAQAFEYEKKSILYEEDYPVMLSASHLSMGDLMTKMNNLSLAEEYLNEAELLLKNKEDRRTRAQINFYKARLAFAKKDYEEALDLIEISYSYFKEKGYTNQIVAALADKTLYAKSNKDLELYEKYIEELEGYIDEVKSISFKYAAISPIAKYYIEKNQTAKAKALMSKLDISLEQIDWADRDGYLEIKAKIAKNEKDYLKSIGYLEQLNEYQDSMRRVNVANQILFSEQQYDREKKNAEINQLTMDAEITKARLDTSRWIIIISLISLTFLSYLIYKLRMQNKKISEQQKNLNLALKDKDILLREIHHRVKNNLQVVSSLLNLQSNYISDNAALEAIKEGKNRVSSMALIHQNLYQEENLTGINCKEYFEDLIDNLFDSYNIKEDSIQLKKEVSDLNLDVETMVPLGLIVNELISNALKHAFRENNEKGIINFYLGKEGEVLILKVEDNGKGMSSENFLNSKSFGNKLIQAFRQKLGATIEIKNKGGTSFTVYIHKYKLAA